MTTTESAEAVRAYLSASAAAKRRAADDAAGVAALAAIADAVAGALAAGGKLLLCGNGGSAADAQHIAAELVVRLSAQRERRALPAIALTTDTSILTACANDYAFDRIFARQVEALGRPGDVLIGISTSGRSANVIEAFRAAEAQAVTRVAFTGGDGGELARMAEHAFVAPAQATSHIQEVHAAALHAVCFSVEARLFAEAPR